MYEDDSDPQRRLILDNPLFIDGSRAAFAGFDVVRPESVRVNLFAPMEGGGIPHVDLAYFRGMNHSSTPMHLLVAMQCSGLFDRWMVNVSSALAWLYQGEGGGLIFWPAGPNQPGCRVAPPLHNRAFISDNQRTFHRIEPFGAGVRGLTEALRPDAVLLADTDAWLVRSGGRVLHRFAAAEIRISLLWKALVFQDEEAARVHDEHLDDLDVEQAIEILREDASRRGISITAPSDIFQDATFADALARAFPPVKHFAPVSSEV
jgi:hypothetical protein